MATKSAILAVKIVSDAKQAQKEIDKFGTTVGGIGRKAKAGLVGLGLGAVAKDAVQLEAQFGRTMNTLGVAAKAQGPELDKLRALAMKLGQDTQFSANEAADAMLELAKAGISTKDIMEGAADGTLLLATAGGTDLATAATIASNAMNTFNLKGKDMSAIAAALAGGANASSASVSSLGEALQQVGPGATNAGLSLQETVAALSAFDAAGVKGSDAGTSLKTFLARLVPQTEKASAAFEELGLWTEKTGSKLVDQNGNFKSLTQIAGLLQKGLKGMSDAERTAALNAAFGSDASRAAIVLGKEGAAGLREYVKATNDQDAAQKLAKASMSGTAGALERMSGAVETAKLALGRALAPTVVIVADFIGNRLAPALTAVADFMGDHSTATKVLIGTLAALVATYAVVRGALATYRAAQAAVLAVQVAWNANLLILRVRLLAMAAAEKATAAGQWLLNAAMSANPIGLVVIAIAALVAALIIAWKKSETFRKIVTGAFDKVRGAASAAFGWVKRNWPLLLAILTGPIGLAVLVIARNWDKIKAGATSVKDWVVLKFDALVGFVRKLPGRVSSAASGLFDGFREAFRNALNWIIDKWNSLSFTLPSISAFGKTVGGGTFRVPQIPRFAEGGIVNGPTLAVLGDNKRKREAVIPIEKWPELLRQLIPELVRLHPDSIAALADALLEGAARVSRGVVANESRRIVTGTNY